MYIYIYIYIYIHLHQHIAINFLHYHSSVDKLIKTVLDLPKVIYVLIDILLLLFKTSMDGVDLCEEIINRVNNGFVYSEAVAR